MNRLMLIIMAALMLAGAAAAQEAHWGWEDQYQCSDFDIEDIDARQDAIGDFCAEECFLHGPEFDACYFPCIDKLYSGCLESPAPAEVPEFGALGTLAVLATIGMFLYRRK